MERQLKKATEQMNLLPEGTLRCTSSNGTFQYHIDGKYISKKEKDYIQNVAQREYDEKIVPLLEKVILKLNEIEAFYESEILENQFNTMCDARKKLVEPLIEPMDMKVKRFMEEVYEPSVFQEDDNSEFYTIRKERVRSKSELIIADELYRYGIPYRYEKPLILENRGRPVKFRPDFTIMNKTGGKILIFEHLGMLDNPDYVEKNINKIDIYEKNGFLLGDNLIVTHETGKTPLSRGVLDSYIEKYLI